MAELYVYNGVHLTLIRDGTVELTESADHGNVGTGRVSLDDAAGTYNVIGHKSFYANQSNCSVPRTFTGYVGRRTYQRNTERVRAARFIDVSLLDLNARLGFRVIRGRTGKRPQETIQERMEWLLASDFLNTLVFDRGFVSYPTDELDKNDYRSQFPLDVIRDCALEKGYNYFVYWDAATSSAGLWFADSNTSTDFSSTLRISNVSTDIDGSTTFAAAQDTSLDRDPSEVYSGVQMQFEKGNVFRSRAATSSNFEPRHAVGPASRVKRRSKAIALADHYLFERRNEEDVISTSMLAVPDTKVNLVRAGQRISARFSDFDTEGYGEFSWFRILEATKKPLNAEGALYDIGLQLSPQESTVCGSVVQVVTNVEARTLPLTLPATPTPGNVLVAVGYRWTTSAVPLLQYLGADAGMTDLGQPQAETDVDGGASRVFAQAKTITPGTPAGPYSMNDDGAEVLWALYELAADFSNRTVLSQANGTAPNVGSATLGLGTLSGGGVAIMAQVVAKNTGHGACLNHNGVVPLIAMGAGWTELYDGRADPEDDGSIPFVGIGSATSTESISTSWAWGPCWDGDLGTWAGIAVLFGC